MYSWNRLRIAPLPIPDPSRSFSGPYFGPAGLCSPPSSLVFCCGSYAAIVAGECPIEVCCSALLASGIRPLPLEGAIS